MKAVGWWGSLSFYTSPPVWMLGALCFLLVYEFICFIFIRAFVWFWCVCVCVVGECFPFFFESICWVVFDYFYSVICDLYGCVCVCGIYVFLFYARVCVTVIENQSIKKMI